MNIHSLFTALDITGIHLLLSSGFAQIFFVVYRESFRRGVVEEILQERWQELHGMVCVNGLVSASRRQQGHQRSNAWQIKDERRADDDVVLICMMCTTNNAWRHGECKSSHMECVHSSSWSDIHTHRSTIAAADVCEDLLFSFSLLEVDNVASLYHNISERICDSDI